jgi:hypothetical protein
MSNYINKDGLLNEEFFTPISNEDFNKQWYVITNNTSFCNVNEAIYSGPHTTKEEAIEHTKFNGFVQSDRWVELLTIIEALAITY